jgi:hypothetical protein
MARQRINKKAPLTNAEKQRRYREKQKANIESLKAAADGKAAPENTSTVRVIDLTHPATAAGIARDRLVQYIDEKLSDYRAWELYELLLKKAKKHPIGTSNYSSAEYQKDQALARVKVKTKEAVQDKAAIRESIKAELKTSWEPELKQARIEAERKKGRELAMRADQSHDQGRTIGICEAAAFFIGKDRADIAKYLLSHFMIDREKAEAALQADKRTRSLTLASLDKSGAWGKPPPVLR